MRKLSIFLLLGTVALLAVPAEAVIEEAEGDLKARPIVCDNIGEVCTTPLIAGQTMIVGEVSVSRGTGELLVTYEIIDPSWSITEIHFEVSADPITEYAPGQYYYKFEDLNTQFYQFIAEDHDLNDCFFAAHAVVTEVVGYEPGPVDLQWLAHNLPDTVTMKVSYPSQGDPSYFATTVSGGTDLDGTYDGWCIDIGRTIGNNQSFPAVVYSSYEDLPDGTVDRPENLDLVNWIINQGFVGSSSPGGYGTYTYGDVQRAIWSLIDNTNSTAGLGSWNEDRVTEIVDAALASGDGFEPDCGDVLAVILVPTNPNTQITIAQITIIDVLVECGYIPVLGDGSETAWGCGHKIREKKNWGWYFHCCPAVP